MQQKGTSKKAKGQSIGGDIDMSDAPVLVEMDEDVEGSEEVRGYLDEVNDEVSRKNIQREEAFWHVDCECRCKTDLECFAICIIAVNSN